MRLDLTLLALVAPLAVVGDMRHSARRNHHEIAKRADASVQLHKRYSSARWTFYDVGGAAGACGKFNSPGEHIVALNSAQYGGGYPGPNCWRKIIMKIGNKQTTATITDECPGCPYGGLDLTRGLFEFFAPLSVGVLSGEWYFADEAPEDPKPSPKPHTTTHKPPPPPPTTTHHHTSTTHHHTTTSTTSSSTHSSTHSSSSEASSSSVNYSSGIISGLASPTGVVSTDNGEPQNIMECNQLLVNIGGLVVAGAQA